MKLVSRLALLPLSFLLVAACSSSGSTTGASQGGVTGSKDDAATGATSNGSSGSAPVSCAAAAAASVQTSPCGPNGCAALPPTCTASCATLGSVHFHLDVPASQAGAYDAVTYTWGADSVSWFSVAPASGGSLQILPPTSDSGPGLAWAPSCSACESLLIAPLQTSQPIGSSGIDGTWTGTSYSTTATCNQPQNGPVPCGDLLCAVAGSYVVTMCATLQSSGVQSCVTVPFEFPAATDVRGTIPG